MTVASAIHSLLVQGTGATFIFGYPSLEIYSDDELLVLHFDANDVQTILAEGTGAAEYAITNNNPYSEGKSDGFITYPADEGVGTEIPVGEYILFVRIPPKTQGNAFRNLGIQLPKNIETALDKLTHSVLLHDEILERCMQVDRAVDPAAIDLTGEDVASLEANAVLTAADVVTTAASVVDAQAIVDNAFVLDTVTDSTTARTLALADATKWIRCTNVAGITITLPQDSDVAFVVGTVVTFEQTQTGVVTFVAGAGATMNKPSTHDANTNNQWSVVQVKLVATDTWIVFGNLAPV